MNKLIYRITYHSGPDFSALKSIEDTFENGAQLQEFLRGMAIAGAKVQSSTLLLARLRELEGGRVLSSRLLEDWGMAHKLGQGWAGSGPRRTYSVTEAKRKAV